MKNKQKVNIFSWRYIQIFSVFGILLFKVWLRIFRNPTYDVKLIKIKRDETIVMAANHQNKLDPMAVFAPLNLSQLLLIAPVKVMTWHKYYNTVYKPILFSMGGFSSHGIKNSGLKGAINFSKQGYRVFIFPEGRRTPKDARRSAFKGVVNILKARPGARVILVHIDWDKRERLLSRPKVLIKIRNAPKNMSKTDPDKIMDTIYSLK